MGIIRDALNIVMVRAVTNRSIVMRGRNLEVGKCLGGYFSRQQTQTSSPDQLGSMTIKFGHASFLLRLTDGVRQALSIVMILPVLLPVSTDLKIVLPTVAPGRFLLYQPTRWKILALPSPEPARVTSITN
jgi:hypothetical protein